MSEQKDDHIASTVRFGVCPYRLHGMQNVIQVVCIKCDCLAFIIKMERPFCTAINNYLDGGDHG